MLIARFDATTGRGNGKQGRARNRRCRQEYSKASHESDTAIQRTNGVLR
jgi:hypothetical protein